VQSLFRTVDDIAHYSLSKLPFGQLLNDQKPIVVVMNLLDFSVPKVDSLICVCGLVVIRECSATAFALVSLDSMELWPAQIHEAALEGLLRTAVGTLWFWLPHVSNTHKQLVGKDYYGFCKSPSHLSPLLEFMPRLCPFWVFCVCGSHGTHPQQEHGVHTFSPSRYWPSLLVVRI
jgi:hypothetical protein